MVGKLRKDKKHNSAFKKAKSTVDCIFAFHSIILKVLSSRDKLYCVFLDYEKAFDRINRSLLWHKLNFEHVSSKLVRAIKSMYNVVKSCIRFKSSHSSFFTSHMGLTQGDPSSPLLFMLFLNDIIENINADFENVFRIEELRIFICYFTRMPLLYLQSLQLYYNQCYTILNCTVEHRV